MQITMHLYTCTDCVAVFGVEAHENLDHVDVVCPLCHDDGALVEIRYNVLVDTEAGDPVEG